MAAPRVELYGYDLSPYVVAVERMLAYTQVPHVRVPVAYHDKRALLAATGQDYVPALLWEGRFVRWDEIPEFLERVRPEPALFPAGQKGTARALEDWGHQVLEERVWRTVVTRIARTLTDPVERWVFEEMQSRVRGSFELLDRRRAEFRRDLEEHLAIVEEMVTDREWVLGSASVADFGIFGALAPLALVGERPAARFGALRRWMNRVQRIPSTEERRRAAPSA
jgi:glutathione S-transferase